MFQKRLYSFILILLFVFAQQQALLHSYTHLTHSQQTSLQDSSAAQASKLISADQEDNNSSQHTDTHSELCSKCVAFAGIASAIGTQTQVLPALLAAFTPFVFVKNLFSSSSYTHYQSRAPPHFFQA